MGNPPTLHYFAYGSNMLSRRLRARTPSARVVSVATLPAHELRWHKAGRDGSGKCDIVPSSPESGAVLGVVFEIALSEKPDLDRVEGLGVGYAERQVEVQTGAGTRWVFTYQAIDIDCCAVPYTWYKALVVAGAREHEFPEDYVQALVATRTSADTDHERETQNLLLAYAG